MDKVSQILKAIGLPFAYHHFSEKKPPSIPYICYLLPNSDNFSADGRVYYKKNFVHIELYTDRKDILAEQKVETVLNGFDVFYEKSQVWIESEKLYQTLYIFEMEV